MSVLGWLLRKVTLSWILIALSLALLINAELARAEGQQVAGEPPACPTGTVLVQMSLGARVIYAGCWSTAELERAGYKTLARTDEGTVTCRTLVVKGK